MKWQKGQIVALVRIREAGAPELRKISTVLEDGSAVLVAIPGDSGQGQADRRSRTYAPSGASVTSPNFRRIEPWGAEHEAAVDVLSARMAVRAAVRRLEDVLVKPPMPKDPNEVRRALDRTRAATVYVESAIVALEGLVK